MQNMCVLYVVSFLTISFILLVLQLYLQTETTIEDCVCSAVYVRVKITFDIFDIFATCVFRLNNLPLFRSLRKFIRTEDQG